MITKVVSGLQLGADCAGSDAAIFLDIESSGWVPLGAFNEGGKIPLSYSFQETLHRDYKERTLWNVRDSDATIIFSYGKLTGGSAYTVKCCESLGKEYLYIDLAKFNIDSELERLRIIKKIKNWFGRIEPNVLNVAGSRESKFPGIYIKVRHLMVEALVLHNKIKTD